MHLAVESGSTSACALLLQHGACVQAINRKLETPLHLAAAAGKQDIVRLLLEAGANSLERNADGHNVFQVAVDEDTRSILVRANGMRTSLHGVAHSKCANLLESDEFVRIASRCTPCLQTVWSVTRAVA